MLGWAIGFFVLAIVAGVFGFGGIATAFTGIAVILFWVFVALFVLSLLFGGFRGGAVVEGGATRGGIGGLGLVALIAVVAIIGYAWVKNDWSAQSVGAKIDHTASEVADATGDALHTAGERVDDVARDTTHDVQNDTANGLRDAGDHVDPDNNTHN